MGNSEGSPGRENHNYTGLPKKETFQIINLTVDLHKLQEQQQSPKQGEGGHYQHQSRIK